MKLKHYKAIAEAIKASTSNILRDEYKMMFQDLFIKDLCAILKAENPKFDEAKFRELLK